MKVKPVTRRDKCLKVAWAPYHQRRLSLIGQQDKIQNPDLKKRGTSRIFALFRWHGWLKKQPACNCNTIVNPLP